MLIKYNSQSWFIIIIIIIIIINVTRSRAMPRVVEYFDKSLKAALSRKINMVTFANLGSVPSVYQL